jgi:hypothetical protein
MNLPRLLYNFVSYILVLRWTTDIYGDGVSARIAKSSLNFKYEELRKATNYFDPANKLGQGSNGAVYKVYMYS